MHDSIGQVTECPAQAPIAPELDTMSQHPAIKARFREICKADATALAELLAEGFPARTHTYWEHALARLAARDCPAGYPQFGYAIEAGGRIVGVVLLVCSARPGPHPSVQCNVSSWYVQPAYRAHAGLLVAFVLKRHAAATFTNISSERHTRPTIEAQGFVRYCDGTFLAVPLLSAGGHRARATTFRAGDPAPAGLSDYEQALLADHAGYGCLVLVAGSGGAAGPLVFRRVVVRGVPVARLVWCRDTADLAHYAGAVARCLARHGLLLVAIDANGPVAGVAGRYFPGRMPKYYRGPDRPRSGDLAYTELAMFG